MTSAACRLCFDVSAMAVGSTGRHSMRKGAARPLLITHPMTGQGLAPPPQTPPPMERRDGSLHLLPKPSPPVRRLDRPLPSGKGSAAVAAKPSVPRSGYGFGRLALGSWASTFGFGGDAQDLLGERWRFHVDLALHATDRPGADTEDQHPFCLRPARGRPCGGRYGDRPRCDGVGARCNSSRRGRRTGWWLPHCAKGKVAMSALRSRC